MAAIIAFLVALVVSVPLIVFAQFRLDLAYRFGLAPGEGVVQIAHSADGVTLIVIPFKLANETARDPYRNRAQFLASRTDHGTDLLSLTTNHTIHIPLSSLDFIAASDDGEHVLIREGTPPAGARSVLIDVPREAVTELPSGSAVPNIPGDWKTPVWQKSAERCGPRSVTGKYIACFPSPAFAAYLAGDWQLDLQLYGNYRMKQGVFRGRGFLPTVGFNLDDSLVYFQNERGIWRATIDSKGFGT